MNPFVCEDSDANEVQATIWKAPSVIKSQNPVANPRSCQAQTEKESSMQQ